MEPTVFQLAREARDTCQNDIESARYYKKNGDQDQALSHYLAALNSFAIYQEYYERCLKVAAINLVNIYEISFLSEAKISLLFEIYYLLVDVYLSVLQENDSGIVVSLTEQICQILDQLATCFRGTEAPHTHPQ